MWMCVCVCVGLKTQWQCQLLNEMSENENGRFSIKSIAGKIQIQLCGFITFNGECDGDGTGATLPRLDVVHSTIQILPSYWLLFVACTFVCVFAAISSVFLYFTHSGLSSSRFCLSSEINSMAMALNSALARLSSSASLHMGSVLPSI